MGIKGDGRKILNVPVLEKTVSICNQFLAESNEELQKLNVEIRRLNDIGIDKLAGTREGDFIVDKFKEAEQNVKEIREDMWAISKTLDDKLGKVFGGYWDKNGITNGKETTKVTKLHEKLKRR